MSKGNLCWTRGNDILVCDCVQNRVYIFDLNGNFQRFLGRSGSVLGEFDAPGGICATEENIFIVDTGNKRIQVLDSNYNPTLGIYTTVFIPGHVCACTNGYIIVTIPGLCFLVLDCNRKFIKGTESLHASEYYLDQIFINSRNEILTVNGPKKIVQIFNQDTELLYSFGDLDPLFNPRSVCVDQYDNILVLDDGNHSIKVFNRDGTRIQEIPTQTSSYGICVSRGKIFTTNEDNSISIISN